MGIPGVHRICEIFEGLALFFGVALTAFMHETYPVITYIAATAAFIIGVHGVYRLVWRWWHGFSNLLTDKELEP